MKRTCSLVILAVLLVVWPTLAACGSLDDAQETADTVDEAVDLLQDVADQATWDYIADGLDELAAQDDGYIAVVSYRAGEADEAGELAGAPAEASTITLTVDGRGSAQIVVATAGTTTEFFRDSGADESDGAQLFRVEDEGFYCEPDGPYHDRLINGLDSVFAAYDVDSLGVQLLAIASETDDDETWLDRDATRYEIESGIPQALAVIESLDEPELRAALEETGEFELSGELVIDQDTLALMRYASMYWDTSDSRRIDFTFEVTQWGVVTEFAPPVPAQIADPCPD